MQTKIYTNLRDDGYSALDGDRNFMYRCDKRCSPMLLAFVPVIQLLLAFLFRNFDMSFVFTVNTKKKGFLNLFPFFTWSLAVIDNTADLVFFEVIDQRFQIPVIINFIRDLIAYIKIALENRGDL